MRSWQCRSHKHVKPTFRLEAWKELCLPPPKPPLKFGGMAGLKMGKGLFSSFRNTSQGCWSHHMWIWTSARVICLHLQAIKCKLALPFGFLYRLLYPLPLLVKGDVFCHSWNQFSVPAPIICCIFWTCDKYPFVLLIKFHICSTPVHLTLGRGQSHWNTLKFQSFCRKINVSTHNNLPNHCELIWCLRWHCTNYILAH